ncbi:MAG: dihydropteroate synthase [Candidatus Lokiarchaeota archaeon]|nr:dihydropteroate synthase [Candidatus Lokiarchaeota archaeon]
MTTDIKIKNLIIGENHPVAIMGIINLSIESFYKQSFVPKEEFKLKLEKMIEEKADIIDIGARSTAPGVQSISIDKEKDRLLPILKQIKDYPDVIFSLDTQFSEIAELGLKHGASMINDISGFRTDEKIIEVIKEYDCPSVIMATKKNPGDALTIEDIKTTLKESIEFGNRYDYDTKNIIIDPGIGRWISEKRAYYNITILNHIENLKILKQPILIGISRKSMIGDILGYQDPLDRLNGTLAATVIGVYNGADVVRTHDVKITRDYIKIARIFRDFKGGRTHNI